MHLYHLGYLCILHSRWLVALHRGKVGHINDFAWHQAHNMHLNPETHVLSVQRTEFTVQLHIYRLRYLHPVCFLNIVLVYDSNLFQLSSSGEEFQGWWCTYHELAVPSLVFALHTSAATHFVPSRKSILEAWTGWRGKHQWYWNLNYIFV